MIRTDRRFTSAVFWTACAVSAGLFLCFYPPIFAFRDEGIYLSLAQVFKAGTIFIEKTTVPLSLYVERNGHHLPFYPPGNPLLLIPFTWAGWKGVFVMGLCMHLIGAFFFRKVAALFDCDHAVTLLLYVFFPSFIFYSRTIMSDIPSLAFFMTAYYFYFKPRPSKALAGVFFGLTLFFRVSNVVVLSAFALGLGIQSLRTRRWNDFLAFCGAAAPFAAAMGFYNTAVYGSPFLSGYSQVFSGVKNFSPAFFASNARHYLLILNVVYPFMMLLFFKNRRIACLETLLLTVFLLIFFSFYYFQDRYPQTGMALILGNRFFYPVIPFFILAFGKLCQNILSTLSEKPQKILIVLLLFSMSAASAIIQWKHNAYLQRQAAERDFIYQNTDEGDAVIYDGNVAELIQGIWGKRLYIDYEGYERLRESVNNLPQGTDIYLVVRKVVHGTTKVPGALYLAMEKLKTAFQFETVAESETMSLYEIAPKEG